MEPNFSTTEEMLQAAEQWLDGDVKASFLEKLQLAIKSGAIDPNIELDYALLKAVLVITAESYFRETPESKKQLANLRCFI